MKRIAALIAAFLLALSTTSARAAIQVGDQAKLNYQTVDGRTVDVESMHGKILVVDFWATWCGPCMAEAGHMVEINKKYGDKGLQILGISLDQDKTRMLTVAKEKGFTWPQYFDGMVWKNKIWAMWGDSGIPFTVLINPLGKVVYAGHPAGGLDAAIDQTFQLTPPHLVDPRVVADATKVLDSALERLADNDAKGAVKLLSKIHSDAKADTDFAVKYKDLQSKMNDAGEKTLAEIDPLIQKESYKEAVVKLKDLSDNMIGLPVSLKAKSKLLGLMSNAQVKAALAEADKSDRASEHNARAAAALAAAEKLQGENKFALAYNRLKMVAKEYADTDAGVTAGGEIKSLERSHPEVIQKISEADGAVKAKAALSMAASYKQSGRTDLARAKYQSVIDGYPGTSYADEAKREMTHLDN
ncbi:MAG TPA: TlpA disulfide reductase family protein [Tepidisphaeraceae bacterium]|jgi:thiol-disulfide isomerase/thioredoxin|nr:TlpA disulfide reductase family protein [Tepidisphaeraceae bacterium]